MRKSACTWLLQRPLLLLARLEEGDPAPAQTWHADMKTQFHPGVPMYVWGIVLHQLYMANEVKCVRRGVQRSCCCFGRVHARRIPDRGGNSGSPCTVLRLSLLPFDDGRPLEGTCSTQHQLSSGQALS